MKTSPLDLIGVNSMEIYSLIDQLILYGVQKELIQREDEIYVRNTLLEKFQLTEYIESEIKNNKIVDHIEVLEKMIKYAYEKGIIESVNPPFSDLFDTSLMATMVPRPSEINRTFNMYYKESVKRATDYFYKLSIDSHYIRMDRIRKNMNWGVDTKYGQIQITVNLSKPEKDPKAIAMAKHQKQTGYPKCLLCYENVGYQGHVNHPGRQSHRVIPLKLNDESWYFQYSPYVYFNEHSIVFKKEHVPMKISEITFIRLLDFVDLLPHYFIGSNADLPIVGGSLLSHDHYQSGSFEFPMETAKETTKFKINGYEDIEVINLNWPLTVLRLRGKEKENVVKLATKITDVWRCYSDESVEVLAESKGEVHNTITPIARKRKNAYELDLVLRNNRTSEEYPDGIFHPHVEIHPVKKENIGLIEVMGLAVLPSRLKEEMKLLEDALQYDKSPEEVEKNSEIYKFTSIYKDMLEVFKQKNMSAEEIVKKHIGAVFVNGLEHSGVFKNDELGKKALLRFVESVV